MGLKEMLDGGKIKWARVLGVCSVAETKVLGTEISLVYSLLVGHENGENEIIEVKSQHIQKYAKYIKW